MVGMTRGKSSRTNCKLDSFKNNPEDSGGVKATELRSQQPNRRGVRYLGVRHAVLYIFVLCTYIYTALPSIPGGDSGELLAEACQWGIPHPPGYPLLIAVHNAMSCVVRSDAIPSLWPKPPTVGEIGVKSKVAFAANLLAGVFGAGTAFMICMAVEEWTRGSRHAYNPGAAAGAALLFSFSPLAWEYNTGTEVFALNNFLVATALYLTARSVRRPSMSTARVGATVCGLALSNQHASILTLAPLVFSVLLALDRASLLSWQAAVELSGLWLPLGLSPYVVLASSAGRPRQGSWGDLSTLWGFLRHISRAEYGTFRLGVAAGGDDTEGMLDRVRQYLVDSSRQTMHLGPPLGLIGIGWTLATSKEATISLKRTRFFTVGLVAAWLSYVVIWHGVLSNISLRYPMNRAVHARFWIQPNLVLCLAAGGGLGVVTNAAARQCRKGGRVVSAALSLLPPIAMVAGMVWLNWDSVDRGVWSGRSHGWTMHLYGQALLSNLPERAVLLSHTDLDLNPARYLRVCEGFRSDVTHISLQMMPYPWWATVQANLHAGVIFPPILPGVSTRRDSAGNAALVTRFLAANIHRGRPIFLDMQAVDERQIGDGGSYHGFSLVPHGLAYRVLPRLTLEETESWHPEIERQLWSLEECMEPVRENEYPPGSWEYAAISVYWDAHYQAGLFFLSYAVGVWAKTPKDEQRQHFLPALRNASTLLRRTLETVDARGTFSSSRSDLLKNTVLAEVRLYHAIQIALAASVASSASERVSTKRVLPASPPVWEDLYAEMAVVKARCLELIPRFLTEALDDKDAEAFGRVYIQLRERG